MNDKNTNSDACSVQADMSSTATTPDDDDSMETDDATGIKRVSYEKRSVKKNGHWLEQNSVKTL